MKNIFLRQIVGTALALMVVVGGLCVSGNAQDADRNSIVGVWINQVTRRDCVTGDPLGPSFQAQNTFAKGGTHLETVAPSPFRSYGNGLWNRAKGENEYSLIQRFMRYDAAGNFIGSGVVRAVITLDKAGENYTSTATNDFLDANENVVGSGCATTVARRFPTE